MTYIPVTWHLKGERIRNESIAVLLDPMEIDFKKFSSIFLFYFDVFSIVHQFRVFSQHIFIWSQKCASWFCS